MLVELYSLSPNIIEKICSYLTPLETANFVMQTSKRLLCNATDIVRHYASTADLCSGSQLFDPSASIGGFIQSLQISTQALALCGFESHLDVIIEAEIMYMAGMFFIETNRN